MISRGGPFSLRSWNCGFNAYLLHFGLSRPATTEQVLRRIPDNRPSESGERQTGQNQRILPLNTTRDGLRHRDQMPCRY